MCTAQLLMFLLAVFRRAHSAFLLSAVTWKWGKCRLELAKHDQFCLNTSLSRAQPQDQGVSAMPFAPLPIHDSSAAQDMGTKQTNLHLMQEPPSLISPAALKSSPQPTEFLQNALSYLFRTRLWSEDTIGKFFEKMNFWEFSLATIKSFISVVFFPPLCCINKHDTLFYKVISFWIIEPWKKHIKPTNLIIFVFLKLKIDLNQVQPAIFPPYLRNYILSFRLK